MRMINLQMRRDEYGIHKGKMVGEIGFENQYGTISLALNDDFCQRILAIVAEGMVAGTKEVAEHLTAEIIIASATLPAPT